jgi:hypothetical protein
MASEHRGRQNKRPKLSTNTGSSQRSESASTISLHRRERSTSTIFRSDSPSPSPGRPSLPLKPSKVKYEAAEDPSKYIHRPLSLDNIQHLLHYLEYHQFGDDFNKEYEVIGSIFTFRQLNSGEWQVALERAHSMATAKLNGYKEFMVKCGLLRQEEADKRLTLEYFDVFDDATEHGTFPLESLRTPSPPLLKWPVEDATQPTITLLAILRQRIQKWSHNYQNPLTEEERRRVLERWIDNSSRVLLTADPDRLYEPYLFNKDMKYAAYYAAKQRRRMINRYTKLWEESVEDEDIVVAMRLRNVTDPRRLRDPKWKVDDGRLVDFDCFDPLEKILDYKLTEPEIYTSWHGKARFAPDPNASERRKFQEQNWRYSIVQFARQAQIVRNQIELLRSARQSVEEGSDVQPVPWEELKA